MPASGSMTFDGRTYTFSRETDFGTGKAVLDDGTVLEVKDLMCFAEDVHNRY